MKKALIIFGSTTGNTEEMADLVNEALKGHGFETEIKNVTDAIVSDLAAGHDILLLGCPSYGDDSIELQEDFQEFYDQWDGVQLKGKSFAVFAPGDSSYEYFCGSVDMIEERMEELGGNKLVDGLKVDGSPGDEKGEILQWTKRLATACA